MEYLDCQPDRSIEKLDAYIDFYAKSMGQLVDTQIRFSAHAIAILRFNMEPESTTGSLAVWETDERRTLTNCVFRPAVEAPTESIST